MKLTICETKLIILCLLDFKIKQATTHITWFLKQNWFSWLFNCC
jgi:hypothetical protein